MSNPKKAFSVIVVFICAVIILSGCANDDYVIEAKYWRIKKQAEKIFKNPQASPPNQLEKIVKIFKNFIAKYPKNSLAVDAEFSIANLYIVKEEYDKGRAQLNKIIHKYNKSKDLIAQALFLTGNSYEIQDKWSLALEQYKKIMLNYSETAMGLDIPVYIAQHYKVKYEPDKMFAAYRDAVIYYKSIAARHPASPIAYNMDLLAARCYSEIKDWQGAIDTFKKMLVDYKGKVNLDGILFNLAAVYSLQLKDKENAKKSLEQLLKDYPKSALKKNADAMLKELGKDAGN